MPNKNLFIHMYFKCFICFCLQNAAAHHPVVPEEKIVPSMQINGYENPTYKYFEVKE